MMDPMRWITMLVGLWGCYAPSIPMGVTCDPLDARCPAGQTCRPFAGGYACTSGDGVDAASSPDAADDANETDGSLIDAPMSDAPSMFCYGTGLIQNLCLAQAPAGNLTISTSVTIDTNIVGVDNCTQIMAQPGGPSLCVVARQSITVVNGGKVVATGANPLVVITTGATTIAGEVDVSSHRGGTIGPGARATCAGAINGASAPAAPSGGGGGGGGGFVGAGANGGLGRGNIAGGTGGTAPTPTVVIGGCPGGTGGAGAGGGGAGAGGRGGGALYVIAGSIMISGTVHASGAGGGGGSGGADSGGGGGGGGAGGMIGFDAPSITVTGVIHANGGGGGGGNGDDINNNGQGGSDPTATTSAPGGSGGTGGGGNGGRGFAQGSTPNVGNNASEDYCGGGGGGGGAGVIRVFQTAPGSLGGMISPSPT